MMKVTNLLDLAASCERKVILKYLVSHGLTSHMVEFENFLMTTEFSYPGEIFKEVVKVDSKVAKKLLNSCVDTVSENTEGTVVKIELNKFSNPHAIVTLLADGHRELFFHPVVEAQTFLKAYF